MNERVIELSPTVWHVIELLAFPLTLGLLLALGSLWDAWGEWCREQWWKEYQMKRYGRLVYPEIDEP